MIKKILVPIDGSKESSKALDYALDLAETCKASVQILHVVPPLTWPTMPYQTEYSPATVYPTATGDVEPVWAREYHGAIEADSEQLLERELKRVKEKKPDLEVSTKILKGRPADMIIGAAKEGGFDLVVVGSRGHGGAREFWLGSVGHAVASNAPCPVVIVR